MTPRLNQIGINTAARYLTGGGYVIKEKLWDLDEGQTAIIAEWHGTTIIALVRTILGEVSNPEAQNIEAYVMEALLRAGTEYLAARVQQPLAPIRFDTISIFVSETSKRVIHARGVITSPLLNCV